MTKLLLVFLFPFVLVAVVLVSPLALIYFVFDRLCDLIETFKPQKSRRNGVKEPGRAARLAQLLNSLPFGNSDNRGLTKTAESSL